MNEEKLAVACINFDWALPIDDFIREKALTVKETFDDARQKYNVWIRKFTPDIRHGRAWYIRETAKEVPMLQQVVDDFDEYYRKILSDKKIIGFVNRSCDLLKNTTKDLVLSETEADCMCWYQPPRIIFHTVTVEIYISKSQELM